MLATKTLTGDKTARGVSFIKSLRTWQGVGRELATVLTTGRVHGRGREIT